MSRKSSVDMEQVLAETWSPELAARVADRVGESPGRSYIVRQVQPEMIDRLGPGDVVWEYIIDAILIETGVDLDQAGESTSFEAFEDVLAILVERWRDGEPLSAVPHRHEAVAIEALQHLTSKAAEVAGCDVEGGEPWEPLRAGGRLRVDVEGLQWYLDTYATRGIEPEERATIHRLMDMAETPPGN